MVELNMAKFNVKNPTTGQFEPLDGATQVRIQSDWNQTNNAAEDYIKNKPVIGAAATKDIDTELLPDSENLITSGAVYDTIDQIHQNFYPSVTGTGSIGTSTQHWGSAYVDTINGNLIGNINHSFLDPQDEYYGITFHPSAGIAETKTLGTNDSLTVRIQSASSGGETTLSVGNNIDTAEGGKFGSIRIYSKLDSYCTLNGNSRTNQVMFTARDHGVDDGAAFIPGHSSVYNLGNNTYKWLSVWADNVYATTLYGSLAPSYLSSTVPVNKGGTGQTSAYIDITDSFTLGVQGTKRGYVRYYPYTEQVLGELTITLSAQVPTDTTDLFTVASTYNITSGTVPFAAYAEGLAAAQRVYLTGSSIKSNFSSAVASGKKIHINISYIAKASY